MGSKLRDRRRRHDAFFRRARQQRFAARSVFKLEEIDKRFRLLRPNQRVLDLGCRPGSWMQYAAQRVGHGGLVVGLDRSALEIPLADNARMVVGDVLETDAAELRGDRVSCFHVVLSDLAPDTTGVPFTDQVRSVELATRALDLTCELGCPGGSFVGKVFMGEGFDQLVARVKRTFARSKTVRPAATRKESREVYLVGLQRKR